MANRYWVGGTANWDATAASKWATTSGGAGGAAVPTTADDVFFDAASGAVTITTSATANMRSLNCTGFTGTFATGASITHNIGDATAGAGNIALKFVAGMTYNGGASNVLNFASTSATVQTIDSGGLTMTSLITFTGTTGSWQLAANYSVGAGSSNFTLTRGTLDLNAKTLTLGSFNAANTNTKALNLTNATVNITTATGWNMTATGTTLTSTGSTINLSGAGVTFTGGTTGGLAYGTVNLTGSGTAIVTGSTNTFVALTRTGTAAKSDALQFNADQTVTTLTLNSNSSVNRLLVSSNLPGTTRTLTVGTLVATNVVDFMDIIAAGAATWTTAASGATAFGDALGNTGITFTPAVTQYYGGAQITGAYYQTNGVSGHYASTPDAAALDIQGDIDIRAKIAADDYTPAVSTHIVGKWASGTNERSYLLAINAVTGNLLLQISTDGTAGGILTYVSSVATGLADGSTKWLRAVRNKVGLTVKFYLSDDGAVWTQLGTTQVSTNVNAFSGGGPVEFGSLGLGTSVNYTGKIYRAQIRNNDLDDGTGIVLDADFSAKAQGTVSFAEASSNAATVTVHSAAGTYSTSTLWTTRVPLPQDNVFINTPTVVTITQDMPRMGANITLTGFAGTFALNSGTIANAIYGNWISGTGMTLSGNSGLVWRGRSSHTITSSGVTFTQAVTITAPGGTYTQLDALTSSSTSTSTVNVGTWTTGSFNLSLSVFAVTTTFNPGTSTITLSRTAAGSIIVVSAGSTYNGGSETYVVPASVSDRIFGGGGKTFGTLRYSVANSPGALTLTGANTFNTMEVGSARQLILPSATTTTVTNWLVNGADAASLRVWGTAVASNYVAAVDSAAISITGDQEILVRASLDSYTTGSQILISKYATATRTFQLGFNSSGAATWKDSTDGTTDAYNNTIWAGASATLTPGTVYWFRLTVDVDDGASHRLITLYTAPDSVGIPGAWTSRGTSILQPNGNLADTTAPLEFGTVTAGTSPIAGNIYRAVLKNGLAGTIVFDADFTTKVFGSNVVADTSGNTSHLSGSGLVLPGIAGNGVTTPDSAALDLTGSLSLSFDGALNDWAPSAQTFFAKRNGGSDRSYHFGTSTLGVLQLSVSFDGSAITNYNASAAPAFAPGAYGCVGVTRNGSNGEIKFWTAATGTTTYPGDTGWSQLGTTVAGATTAIFAGTSLGTIGGLNNTISANLLAGTVKRFQAWGSINGTSKVLDANFATATAYVQTFVESANSAVMTVIGMPVTYTGTVAQTGDGRLTLSSSSAGSAATLSSASGNKLSDRLLIQDSTATGGATWYAGSHSINVSNNTGWIFGDYSMVVADATSAHSTDGITLTQAHTLAAVADASHAHTADSVLLEQIHLLVPADGSHGHTADAVTLAVQSYLDGMDAILGITSDEVALTQAHTLVTQDALSLHYADRPAIWTGVPWRAASDPETATVPAGGSINAVWIPAHDTDVDIDVAA